MMTPQETAKAIRQMHEHYVVNTFRDWPETPMPFTFFGDKCAMLVAAIAAGRDLDRSYWLWQIERSEELSFKELN